MHHQVSLLAAPVEQHNSRTGACARTLRSTFFAALVLGLGFWGTPAPALASPTLISAPDGTYQGKIDTTGTLMYGMTWRIFSRAEALELLATAKRCGLTSETATSQHTSIAQAS